MSHNSGPNFVLLGAAGFVAPRHIQAIKNVGGNLLAAMDPHDSVGILDSYFPDCAFFTEFERFDRHCTKIADQINYVSVCSSNHLHDAHCRFAMRLDADPICEKPLVLNERNLDGLIDLENKTGRKVHTILQLRYNPKLQALKNDFEKGLIAAETSFLEYYTPRGKWYHHSWKTDMAKSGGLMTNIGIHLVDALCWIFGPCTQVFVSRNTENTVNGRMEFENMETYFTLSIAQTFKPSRILKIAETPHELSGGFKNLHDFSYEEIVNGRSFGIEDTREAIKICEEVRAKCLN
jgi:UDP-N-acetyl-2-amino-2-deoxyglucuronate dehydrogenase